MADRQCAAMVLAAGASRRLGRPKQLLLLHGESLVRRTARLAGEAGCEPVYVVCGAEAAAVAAEVTGMKAQILLNPEWQEGMGSSLRCGVAAATLEICVSDVLVLVCDQPSLSTEFLRSLWTQHTAGGCPITAARYAGKMGVPAVFSRQCFPELLKSVGDRGARALLQLRTGEVGVVDFPGGEMDLDRPEDVAAWKEKLG